MFLELHHSASLQVQRLRTKRTTRHSQSIQPSYMDRTLDRVHQLRQFLFVLLKTVAIALHPLPIRPHLLPTLLIAILPFLRAILSEVWRTLRRWTRALSSCSTSQDRACCPFQTSKISLAMLPLSSAYDLLRVATMLLLGTNKYHILVLYSGLVDIIILQYIVITTVVGPIQLSKN